MFRLVGEKLQVTIIHKLFLNFFISNPFLVFIDPILTQRYAKYIILLFAFLG